MNLRCTHVKYNKSNCELVINCKFKSRNRENTIRTLYEIEEYNNRHPHGENGKYIKIKIVSRHVHRNLKKRPSYGTLQL